MEVSTTQGMNNCLANLEETSQFNADISLLLGFPTFVQVLLYSSLESKTPSSKVRCDLMVGDKSRGVYTHTIENL